MRRDNRHCAPGCCKKKKKKKNHFIKRVLPHEKTFRFERKIGIFPGLNRAKISILFGPTTKLPLHCSATAIYIQDGNMVIVIKPSANSYDDYAQSREGFEKAWWAFSRFFSPIDRQFLSSPALRRFPSILLPPTISLDPLQTTFFFLEPIIFTNARTWTDACPCVSLRLKLIN